MGRATRRCEYTAPLETERLFLRAFEDRDVDAVFDLRSRPEVGQHRVIGRAEARNTASARVMEKLGMRREAHLVQNEWVKGEWQSELVYAILDREWR